MALGLPRLTPERSADVTQRWIEVILGRLVTDEELRRQFIEDPRRTVVELIEAGMQLSRSEIAALTAIDSKLWERTAEQIRPALQRVDPKCD
jgi:hypothetical protein